MNLWDSTYKLKMLQNGYVAIPIEAGGDNLSVLEKHWPEYSIAYINLPLSKKITSKRYSPSAQIISNIKELLNGCGLSEDLLSEVPTKWERHGDLVIIPQSSFLSSEWQTVGLENLWSVVAKSLCCSRLARHSAVSNNGFRSSQVVLLLGEDGVVSHTDNGIRYCYDVTKCMFSAGNITEKMRVASMDCRGETVVDLYAGIGYFTLPYLVHAKAEHVHACEWNPDAVLALKNSLVANGVSSRCTIHPGDNRQLNLASLADRVNLGLIPSSEEGWPIAVRVLKNKGGILHVHGNVTAYQQYYAQNEPDVKCDKTRPKSENVDMGTSVNVDVVTSANLTSRKLPHNETVEEIGVAGEPLNTPSHLNQGLYVCHGKEEKNCSIMCHHQIETNNLLSGFAHSDQNFNVKESTSKNDLSHLLFDNYVERNKTNLTDRDPFSKSGKSSMLLACKEWSNYVCAKIKSFLEMDKGGKWAVDEKHTEFVKWYAPHVMHVVLDLNCRPRD